VSSLAQIADGLQATLRTIPAFDQNVLKVVRRPHSYPACILHPPVIPDYGLSLTGLGAEMTVRGTVLVGAGEAENEVDLWPFIDWVGPSSIALALNANRNLGLSDVDARLRSWDEAGLIELPDGSVAYGAPFTIGIFAS
jgi:hypothetical protein